jgi:hypothetical protein
VRRPARAAASSRPTGSGLDVAPERCPIRGSRLPARRRPRRCARYGSPQRRAVRNARWGDLSVHELPRREPCSSLRHSATGAHPPRPASDHRIVRPTHTIPRACGRCRSVMITSLA